MSLVTIQKAKNNFCNNWHLMAFINNWFPTVFPCFQLRRSRKSQICTPNQSHRVPPASSWGIPEAPSFSSLEIFPNSLPAFESPPNASVWIKSLCSQVVGVPLFPQRNSLTFIGTASETCWNCLGLVSCPRVSNNKVFKSPVQDSLFLIESLRSEVDFVALVVQYCMALNLQKKLIEV